ncbi:hypothetical protein J7S78_14130 [Klebsiella oxytoca]|uniref:Uncharacterized protein n=1 Tax=Klebsiella oxytoca TaxID=571 RepID=A0AAP2BJX0_KLEOX|nr:hypothetical protein [Klebsiella oxytoca]MBQ0600933.1 hypothetical protein [Klebsiella oxytoca]
MTESIISDTQISVGDVINSLPDCWKNTPRIMNPLRAKLNNGAVSMLVDIDEQSISFMVFISEKKLHRSESIELSKNTFSLYGAREVIRKITPLVDEWNKAASEIEDKIAAAKDVFMDIISMAKTFGIAVIPSMIVNSFHFKNAGDKHYGEIAECGDGNYRLVLNKLNDEEVKSILALITGNNLNPV